MKTAVVGHVEWATFTRVSHVPHQGEIVHGEDPFDVPAGGGAVAAVQLMKLAGECTFFTAFGDDDLGGRAKRELEAMGVRVEAVFRDQAQRRAFVHVDDEGERTITVLGPRLGPHGADALAWDELGRCDGVYFCAGDDDALARARRARVLVVAARERERIARSGIALDAVVGSATDPSEQLGPLSPAPKLIVATEGRAGGTYRIGGGRPRPYPAHAMDDPVIDTYGAGDSFAAGLTFALADRRSPEDAVAFAACCGAACVTGRGPYDGQLTQLVVSGGQHGAPLKPPTNPA